MAYFRKRPVVIEAMRWDVVRMVDDHTYIVEIFGWLGHDAPIEAQDERLMIRTLEGDMYANPGDWIIRGIKGELYPCKPDIFEATYEPVE